MSIFTRIKPRKVKRTTFNLSHNYVGNVGFGQLIPIQCIDVVPDDTFKFNSEVLVQAMPMLASIYGDMDVKIESFFVPNRIIWPDWEDKITGGEDGTLNPTIPTLLARTGDAYTVGELKGTLWDYLGLPINTVNNPSNVTDDTEVLMDERNMPIALPFWAMRRIWNDWYRNENLQDELSIEETELDPLITPLYRNWRKDYFTSALPFVQRGVAPLVQVTGQVQDIDAILTSGAHVEPYGELIELPGFQSIFSLSDLGDYNILSSRLVVFDGRDTFSFLDYSPTQSDNGLHTGEVLKTTSPINTPKGAYFLEHDVSTDSWVMRKAGITPEAALTLSGNIQGLSFDINELRRVNSVQKWLEMNARAGGRYIEQIASHFGVVVPDYRLQRSEFIGGVTTPIRIGQVLQNNTPDGVPTETDALGYPAGTATSSARTGVKRYYVQEHGWIITFMSIVPKAQYFQGLERKFFRRDKFDYYWPEFAHLGEEAVQAQELYWSEDSGLNTDTFGYQSRFAAYKWQRDQIVGDFRDNMSYWTLRRDLNISTALNSNFVSLGGSSNSTLRNIFSVPSNLRPFRFYVKNHVLARRPMPKYGVPKL